MKRMVLKLSPMMWSFALFVLFLLVSVTTSAVDGHSSLLSLQSEVLPVETTAARVSLFVEDTCAPPCWFGLTPGKSTSADIDRLLTARGDLFYGGIDRPINATPPFNPTLAARGGTTFTIYFRYFYRDDIAGAINSSIVIEDGIISWMKIHMNRLVTLGETLRLYGLPDQVTFELGLFSTLSLRYHDRFHRVDLVTAMPGPYSRGQQVICSAESLADTFWVNTVHYYDEENDVAANPDLNELDAGYYPGDIIPPALWIPWFKDGATVQCETAVNTMLGNPSRPKND